jgi:hypothetical protein
MIECPSCNYAGANEHALKRHWANKQSCRHYYENLLLADVHTPSTGRTSPSNVSTDEATSDVDDMMDVDVSERDDASVAGPVPRASGATSPACVFVTGAQLDRSEERAEARLAKGDRFVGPFQGTPAKVIRVEKTSFERVKDAQERENEAPYSPFANAKDWELAKWMAQNLSKRQMDELLATAYVS